MFKEWRIKVSQKYYAKTNARRKSVSGPKQIWEELADEDSEDVNLYRTKVTFAVTQVKV
jgi:hypothetical protein